MDWLHIAGRLSPISTVEKQSSPGIQRPSYFSSKAFSRTVEPLYRNRPMKFPISDEAPTTVESDAEFR